MLSHLPRRWSCAGCVLLLAGAVDAGSQTLMFTRDDIPSDAGARAIAAADFDRNGWPDIAHANVARDTVSIVLNHPDAGLARAFEIPVAIGPFDMTAADFNRDDIPDLAVACADASAISVLLGRGDGTFTRTDLAASGQNPRGITNGDVNKDGKTDLIYTGWSTRTVQVFLGDGAGGFAKGVTFIGSQTNPQGVATADFDRDGRLDVAVVYAGAGGLRILSGNGGTAFIGRTVAGNTNLNVVATGDFNADGWTDVAAASTSSSIVSINLGSATGLTHAENYQTGASPRDISVADVNQDGVLDVLTANRSSSTVTVLLGDRAHPGRFVTGPEIGAATGSRALVANDFNADGRVDIVTGNEYATSVTLLSNDTAFTRAAFSFTRRMLVTPGDHFSQFGMRVLTADFNRDGKMDVCMFRTLIDDEPATLTVVLTGGATVDLPAVGVPTDFAVADANADGNPDIIYSALSPDGDFVATFLGNGRGAFTASPPSASSIVGRIGMAAGDLNRDSKADVVLFSDDFGDDSVVIPMIGKGDGTFAGTEVTGSAPTAPILVDVNRDAKLDLAGLDDVLFRIWLGDGTGGLASSFAAIAVPESVEHFQIADVNADGYVDAVFVSGLGIDISLGSASGFAPPVQTSSFELCGPSFGESCWINPDVFVLADVDLDGKLDVITAGGDIVHGRADGGFGPAESFDVDGVDVAVTDFNGDGLPDIVYITSFGEVAVLINERRSMNRPPTVTAGPDRTLDYQDLLFVDGVNPCFAITAVGTDPDLHRLSFVWRTSAGAVVGQAAVFQLCASPGIYPLSVTVADNRGGTASDAVVITVTSAKEIVLHLSQASEFQGDWSLVADSTAADGVRAHAINRGAAKVNAPIPFPGSLVVVPSCPTRPRSTSSGFASRRTAIRGRTIPSGSSSPIRPTPAARRSTGLGRRPGFP